MFGLDFETDKNNKPTSRAIKDIFDFQTEGVWKIHPKDDSRGTGVPRKKRTSQGASDLIKAIDRIKLGN